MMEANTQKTKAPSYSSNKMLKAMVGIGVACALLIVTSYQSTLPRIQRLREEALQKAIFKVVPNTSTAETFVFHGDGFSPQSSGQEGVKVYAAYDAQGGLSGVAIEASGQGYADVIRILYGYDPEREVIVGFHVLESKETPGLGDKIEKAEHFLANFKALDVRLSAESTLINEVVTVKQGQKTQAWEVDGITGATISSRAIGDILNESAQIWMPRIQQYLSDLEKTEP